jgi:hypothetical protein
MHQIPSFSDVQNWKMAMVRGGIGYSMTVANGTEVSFRYDAEGRSDYLNHTASLRAKWAF